MEYKKYIVKYSGNATRYKNLKYEIEAISKRFAVEEVYCRLLDKDYFPDENGNIYDADNNRVAASTDESIEYDGGHFYALDYEKTLSTN